MSRIIANNIRHNDATSDNITLDGSNNVTTANNFTAGGTLGCTGDLTITSGNLVVSSGNGIDFSATGGPTNGSGTSELLDDYEEGTFTPTIRGASSATYTAQVGRYVKVGELVWAYLRVGWSAVSGASYVNFSGLPFAVSSSNINAPATIGEFSPALTSGYSYPTYYAGPSAYSTDIFAVQHKQDGTTADLPIGSTGNVGLVVVYRV